MKNLHFDTLLVHAGYSPDKTTLSRAVPIYQTTAFAFNSCEHAANLFELKENGNIYTRLMNPTSTVYEQRVAALEGGVGALSVASGQSAQLIAITALVRNGQNFVTSPFLYGGSYNQFKVAFKNFGIEARFAKNDTAEELEKLIDHNTRAIYVESIGNPSFSVPDFDALATLARKYDIPLVVDNTFGAAGYLCRPLDLGANILVEAATKWIGGHGTAMGGIIVDGGNFNWGNGKFPQLSEPSEGYHGLKFWDTFGNQAFIVKCRVEGLRDLGPCSSPFDSFLMIQGLETLSLRVERETQNATKLAHYFLNHPKVETVIYPGLESHPTHKNAKKYLQNGFGAVLSVVLKGEKRQTVKFIESLEIVSHVTNVGDTKSIITHPASTTHQQLSAEEQLAAGVLPTLLRISAGVEHIDDLIADFEQSFSKI